jgi:hypothetical protein
MPPLVRGALLDGNLLAIYGPELLAGAGRLPRPGGCRCWRACPAERALLGELFYLLATIRDPAAVKTIAQSLRSPRPEVRANATEALESLTAPQTAALIAPLFEPDQPSSLLLSLARQTWDVSIPTPAAALRVLASQHDAGDAWHRTLAAAASAS